jgi:hypothetical protein
MTSNIKEIKTRDSEPSFMLNGIYSVGPAFGKWCCTDMDCVANVSKEPATSLFMVKEYAGWRRTVTNVRKGRPRLGI